MQWKRLWILLTLLVAANAAGLLLLPSLRYHQIVVHQTASTAGSLETIRAGHRTRLGLSDAAYHLVLSNGSAGIPLGHLEASSRYRRLAPAMATKSIATNITGLHLCVVGNYDEGPVPPDLALALGHAVKLLQKRFAVPDRGIRLHRDVGATACPGRHITREQILSWVAGASACAPEVARQQRSTIAQGVFTPETLPRKARLAMAGGNGLGLLMIGAVSYRRRTQRRTA